MSENSEISNPTDDDIPFPEVGDPFWFASQNERPKYAKALGEFLVEFNHIEQLVYGLVREMLTYYGFPKLAGFLDEKTKTLGHAIDLLDHILQDCPKFTGIDCSELKALSGFRNKVAHGAFVERFDATEHGIDYSYEIAPRNPKQRKRWTPDDLEDFQVRAIVARPGLENAASLIKLWLEQKELFGP